MRTSVKTVALCVAVLSLTWATAGVCDPIPQSKIPKFPRSNGPVARVALALDLAAWGRANEDCYSLALSAKILGAQSLRQMPGSFRTAPRQPGGRSPARNAASLTATSLVAEAKAMCTGDEKALASIDSIGSLSQTARGYEEGAMCGSWVLTPRAIDTLNIPFKGNESADLAVRTFGNTELGCILKDPNGQVVAAVAEPCFFHWVPPTRATYRLEIRNLENMAGEYWVCTN